MNEFEKRFFSEPYVHYDSFNAGYRKAIDDFVNACKDNILCQTFGLRQCDIEKIAEQLKAGISDGNI